MNKEQTHPLLRTRVLLNLEVLVDRFEPPTLLGVRISIPMRPSHVNKMWQFDSEEMTQAQYDDFIGWIVSHVNAACSMAVSIQSPPDDPV